MNKTRWLVVLLLTSWTLNVALMVALYLKTQYPAGGFWTDSPAAALVPMPFSDEPPCPPMMMDDNGQRDRLYQFHAQRQQLMMAMAGEFAKDSLDSARINAIADSLEQLRRQMQELQIEHLTRMHDKLPPSARRELVPRVMRHFGGERGGPFPGHPQHFRRQSR